MAGAAALSEGRIAQTVFAQLPGGSNAGAEGVLTPTHRGQRRGTRARGGSCNAAQFSERSCSPQRGRHLGEREAAALQPPHAGVCMLHRSAQRGTGLDWMRRAASGHASHHLVFVFLQGGPREKKQTFISFQPTGRASKRRKHSCQPPNPDLSDQS